MGQIHRISGNLLACTGILVHGCNCKGVMGSGVAAAIRNRWPDVYKAYREKFLHDGLRLGDAVVVASSADRQRWSLRTKVSAWSEQLASATMVVNPMPFRAALRRCLHRWRSTPDYRCIFQKSDADWQMAIGKRSAEESKPRCRKASRCLL